MQYSLETSGKFVFERIAAKTKDVLSQLLSKYFKIEIFISSYLFQESPKLRWIFNYVFHYTRACGVVEFNPFI